MIFAPRPYQSESANKVQAHYRAGEKRVLLNSPTGSGKSRTVAWMIERSQLPVLVLCHREELRDMICESLTVPHDIIEGSRRLTGQRVCVGMFQTVANRLDRLPKFRWVIEDECHICMAPTFRKVIEHYGDAWHLGLSATPCRMDGQGLGNIYGKIVYGPSVRELTNRGYLASLPCFCPRASGRSTEKIRLRF